jgi:hydrogenase maturation factor HypF (carbamoyltransferase family)
MNKRQYNKCIGVIVKNPNARNPLKKSSIGDLFAALAKTIPQETQYTFESLLAMKKPQLIAIANDQNVKIWLSWNKTKIANAIIGEV